MKTLNTLVINDAAAYLFWNLAESIGVVCATELVMETKGHCLLEQHFTKSVLNKYNIDEIADSELRELVNAIKKEAYKYAINNENNIGTIYADDYELCISPSAQRVDTSFLNEIPRFIGTIGQEIEKIGKLCMRHPLPAIVFSETRPVSGVLEVLDTSSALGFQMPMFLSSLATQQISKNLFASNGIFNIPVPSIEQGNMWCNAIQNSSGFIHRLEFYNESNGLKRGIEVNW